MLPVSTNIKIDRELKKQAQQLFDGLGLNLSTAVNIFLRQAVREQSIPFRIGSPTPNPITLSAFAEGDAMLTDPTAPIFKTTDALFKDLDE